MGAKYGLDLQTSIQETLKDAVVDFKEGQEDRHEKKQAEKEKTAKKMISAKIDGQLWERFTEINKKNGMSNSSCLNLLIANFNRKNGEII